MDCNVVFYKYTENIFQEVDKFEDSNYVMVPADEYVSINEWNDLIDQYELAKDQYQRILKLNPLKTDENSVVIAKKTYNGFMKMLKVLRDRGIQNIQKSVADEHGYTTKFISHRAIDREHPDLKAYYITKTTPISLHVDVEAAYVMIMQDLKEFYNFIDISAITTPNYKTPESIDAKDLLLAMKQKEDPNIKKCNYYISNDEYGYRIREFVDGNTRPIIFELSNIHGGNIGKGLFEITYIATGVI